MITWPDIFFFVDAISKLLLFELDQRKRAITSISTASWQPCQNPNPTMLSSLINLLIKLINPRFDIEENNSSLVTSHVSVS